jgi:hypothetical protein
MLIQVFGDVLFHLKLHFFFFACGARAAVVVFAYD